MPWQINEITDNGSLWYRFHVVGVNTDTIPPEKFSWSVPDIAEDRFVAHPDAPESVRQAIASAKKFGKVVQPY